MLCQEMKKRHMLQTDTGAIRIEPQSSTVGLLMKTTVEKKPNKSFSGNVTFFLFSTANAGHSRSSLPAVSFNSPQFSKLVFCPDAVRN